MYSSEYKGVMFIEGIPENCQVLKEISTEINELFGQSQLKSLDDIKDKMIDIVRREGGNAIVDFKYGQRSSFWKSFFSLDAVHWFASGKIALIH